MKQPNNQIKFQFLANQNHFQVNKKFFEFCHFQFEHFFFVFERIYWNWRIHLKELIYRIMISILIWNIELKIFIYLRLEWKQSEDEETNLQHLNQYYDLSWPKYPDSKRIVFRLLNFQLNLHKITFQKSDLFKSNSTQLNVFLLETYFLISIFINIVKIKMCQYFFIIFIFLIFRKNLETILEAGSSMVQTFYPFSDFKTHFSGFAMHSNDFQR